MLIKVYKSNDEVQPIAVGSSLSKEEASYILTLGSYEDNNTKKEAYSLISIPKLNSLESLFSSDFLKKTTEDLKEVFLEIAVAPDEESAGITVHLGEKRFVLPPRVHYYLLAFLAREKSWVDCEFICRELRISRELLAQQVFRIRHDFKNINPVIADKIIDRSLRCKMRIGINHSKTRIFTMS
jgi:hypothetical protein